MSSEELQIIEPSQIGDYSIRGPVGVGAFSVVKLVCHTKTNLFYACKIVPKTRINTKSLQERFELEIRINQQLHHPGVVAIHDLLKDDNNYYVIMEFCPNGELFQYIVDREHLSEDEAKPFVRQILETLQYIHDNGISHRDLKPENLLLDSFGKVKLSDFGLSRYIPANGLVDTPCGSPCYASPECISGNSYDGRTTDVWSIGVIIYAMLTGQLPWTKKNQAQLFAQIKRGEYTIPPFLSADCQSFVKGLMTVSIKDRLTIEQALEHPWLYGVPTQYDKTELAYHHVSLKMVDRIFCYDIDEEDLKNLGVERDDIKSTENLTFTRTLKMFRRVRVRQRTANRTKRIIIDSKQPEQAVNQNNNGNVGQSTNNNQITEKNNINQSVNNSMIPKILHHNPGIPNRSSSKSRYQSRHPSRPKSILQNRPIIQKPIINK